MKSRPSRGEVVLVHGIWMNGLEMGLLAWRLRRLGYRVHRFRYFSIRHSLEENSKSLRDFILSLSQTGAAHSQSPPIHIVAHSLGGLIVRHMCLEDPPRNLARIVSLGTPHSGCLVAHALMRRPLGRYLLGRSRTAFFSSLPGWRAQRDFGVIAGTIPIGVGRFIARMPKPNDGTVALSETRLTGMSDYIVLNVSHISMLLSGAVCDQIDHFLQQGRFQRSQ